MSNSRLLNRSIAGDDHIQVVEKVRELLRHYVKLEVSEQQELPEADKQLFGRALRIQKFFTQPFFVAEAYTDTPGEFVAAEETVKDFKELL